MTSLQIYLESSIRKLDIIERFMNIYNQIMKNTLSKQIESALTSILGSSKPPGVSINICYQGDLQDFFRLQRQGICRYFLKNECKKGDGCEFKHSQDQIKTKYKTKLCKNYTETGYCKYKDQCSYAHGDKQLKGGEHGNNHHNKYPRSSDQEN